MKVFLCLALFVAMAFAEPPIYRQQQQQQQRYFFARQQEDTTQAASGPYPARGWKPDGPAFNLPERQQQAPAQVDNSYGPPAQPQQQYGPPAQPQQQYGPPQPPKQQYGPPPPAKQQYAPPSQPQVSIFRPQFGRQQQQPAQPQNQYGAPQQPAPQQQYGAPQQPAPQQYGAPQQPPQYGAPEFTTESTQEIEEPTTVGALPEPESASPSSVNEFQDDAEIDGAEQNEGEARQNQESGQYYVALPDGRLQRVQYVSRQDIEAMRYFAKIQAENVEPLRGPIYAYSPLQKLEVTPGALTVSAGAAPVVPLIGEAPNTLTVTATERKPEKLVAPKVDIKPLAQLQIQHDNPQTVVPLSSSYATYTANYQVPAAPIDNRFILALP